MALQGIAHKNLTDPQLHEIKGAAAAELNQVPFANGEGGTTFGHITLDKLSFEKQEVEDITPTVKPAPYSLNISAMTATTTKVMSDVSSWIETSKNLKELGQAHNDLVTAYLALKAEHDTVLLKLNSLLSALRTLGLLEDAT